MCCDEMREMLGPYVDGEVTPETRAAIEAHVCTCQNCRCEVGRLQELGDRIKTGGAVCVPTALWERIERQIGSARTHRRIPRLLRLRSIIAAAACLVLSVGGGYLVLHYGLGSRVEAATVNFSALLDGLSVDAEAAFRKFISQYRGRLVSAADARQHARQLDFAIPAKLPGGFDLEEAFALQIGDDSAAAAIYRRDGEFVGTIFHRAIHPEDYGTYRDHPCVVGEHRGHRVDVGEWRLIHVTDATTCHCVLSRLDERTTLPPILNAVAANSASARNAPDRDDHP